MQAGIRLADFAGISGPANRTAGIVLLVVVMIAVIVAVDVVFLRDHFRLCLSWQQRVERLATRL